MNKVWDNPLYGVLGAFRPRGHVKAGHDGLCAMGLGAPILRTCRVLKVP